MEVGVTMYVLSISSVSEVMMVLILCNIRVVNVNLDPGTVHRTRGLGDERVR